MPKTTELREIRGKKLKKGAYRLTGTRVEVKCAGRWQPLPGRVTSDGFLQYEFKRADGGSSCARLDLLLLAVARAVTK